MLLNTFRIINYFTLYSNNVKTFLSYLNTLYSTSEFDYKTQCNSGVLLKYGANFNTSGVLNSYSKTENNLATIVYINLVKLFYPSFIQQAYCLSFYNIPPSCPACSSGCSYMDLDSSTFVPSCNVSACGNQNLACFSAENFIVLCLETGIAILCAIMTRIAVASAPQGAPTLM